MVASLQTTITSRPATRPMPGDHAGAMDLLVVHLEGGERPDLEEGRAGIEQAQHALARQELAAGGMALARFGVAAERGRLAALAEFAAQRVPGLGIGARLGRIQIDLALDDRHVALSQDPSSVESVMDGYLGAANRRSCQHGRPENALELGAQHIVDIGHRHRQAEIDQRGHAMLADAARHDAVEMGEVRLDIQRDAVERDPAPDADADRGDLILSAGAVA
jgi:hypothetical protein